MQYVCANQSLHNVNAQSLAVRLLGELCDLLLPTLQEFWTPLVLCVRWFLKKPLKLARPLVLLYTLTAVPHTLYLLATCTSTKVSAETGHITALCPFVCQNTISIIFTACRLRALRNGWTPVGPVPCMSRARSWQHTPEDHRITVLESVAFSCVPLQFRSAHTPVAPSQ